VLINPIIRTRTRHFRRAYHPTCENTNHFHRKLSDNSDSEPHLSTINRVRYKPWVNFSMYPINPFRDFNKIRSGSRSQIYMSLFPLSSMLYKLQIPALIIVCVSLWSKPFQYCLLKTQTVYVGQTINSNAQRVSECCSFFKVLATIFLWRS
jgi:hypothetical protein